MAKLKIVVVEDELIIADNICNTLQELGYEIAEPAISYTEALETIELFKPDLALLDIQLSGKKDGIDLAWKIKENYNFPIIFLTSNADKLTIDRVKKLTPAAYLVKPFNKDELYTSIEIALYNFTQQETVNKGKMPIKDSLFIKQKNLFIKLKFEDILFIQSDHVYIEVITTDGQKYLVRDSLSKCIKKLDNNFIRVHRGYIINLSHLQTIDHNFIKIGDNKIPIGKHYRDELLSRIKPS